MIGSRTSEILTASVHFSWDEEGMEDVPSPKTVLDNKKYLEEKFCITNADMSCLLTDCVQFFFFFN